MKRVVIIGLALIALAVVARGPRQKGVRVGSKADTESIILGEILTQAILKSGAPAIHLDQLGGTRIVFEALQRGEIDLYIEFSGTLMQEIFANHPDASQADAAVLLRNKGLLISGPLGFSNNYALAVRRETAEEYDLTTIEDLAVHPNLRIGFSNEFLDRDDGWKNLRRRYGLTHGNVAGMEHEVSYRQLAAKTIDVMDAYTTDPQIAELDLVVLDDNLGYFPDYDGVVLYREDLRVRYPGAVDRIAELEGAISTAEVMKMNGAVRSKAASTSRAAADFLRDKFSIEVEVEETSVAMRIWQRTLEHCDLVRRSLIPAIFTAIALGIVAAKLPRLGQLILGAVGIVQTIPALALLVLLIAPVAALNLDTVGSTSATAIAALFLYSLLPIVRNTATGLLSISPEHRESATALGLSPTFRLLHVELPLALPSILAGIKTAAILNVGFATLGALVGARGYGQPILTGIRLNDTGLILQGAVPAAGMAISLQILFELAERWLLPAGLRPATHGASDDSTH